VYVALDRDATDRAIMPARTFGARGGVLISRADLTLVTGVEVIGVRATPRIPRFEYFS